MIDLSKIPEIMGVINCTPDSFYSDSRVSALDGALRLADQMVSEGATLLDIGGEATHPNLNLQESPVSLQEELDRVIAIVEAIHQRFDIQISIDTSKPEVMLQAVNAGASMINDQRALSQIGALETAAKLQVPVCLMHMYGVRVPNQQAYAITLQEIKTYLLERATACLQAGILKEHIKIDPGFGHGAFGKSTEESLYMLKHLAEFVATTYPVLVGFSRKTLIGEILNLPIEKRLYGSLGLAVSAALNGAAIIRTHDVAATLQAVTMAMALAN